MRLAPATLDAAKQRWNKYTRHVVCSENKRFLRSNPLLWAYSPFNRTAVAGVIQNGRFCPLYWFYFDQTDGITFASVDCLKLS